MKLLSSGEDLSIRENRRQPVADSNHGQPHRPARVTKSPGSGIEAPGQRLIAGGTRLRTERSPCMEGFCPDPVYFIYLKRFSGCFFLVLLAAARAATLVGLVSCRGTPLSTAFLTAARRFWLCAIFCVRAEIARSIRSSAASAVRSPAANLASNSCFCSCSFSSVAITSKLNPVPGITLSE